MTSRIPAPEASAFTRVWVRFIIKVVDEMELVRIWKFFHRSGLNPTLPVRARIQLPKNVWRETLKKLIVIATAVVFCSLTSAAFAQGFDAAFGFGSVTSAQATVNSATNLTFPSLRGGLYPGFTADLLVHHRFGLEGDLFWKASQGLYGGYQPYRPIFWSFNGIWVPHIAKNFSGEVLAGIGAEDLRFYGFVNCNAFFGCTSYASSNHFMGDVGAGLRAYFWHDAFIRPELRLYLVHNN